ncbi:MAG: phosphoribosylanthranilate isomerase [Methanobrevibacter thaueri]|uniref:N-(5'-phosphoribosyl)anthranilate isomerase n=1 Tax=Methanobrevibacter thaueri TaxID=190975 RepID=A0A8T3VC58_9EURY|nr:phosphoribosylanthranilate isomerase [Methanobrevibacter thaueri]MBE6500854.1 phosphoribosylanthranilate isomerase [Methanobrevibacter thaueri]
MVKIKICGIKRLEDIEMVNRYKPDYIGFVFADSKRKVSHDLAKELKDNLDSDIISVGVFVDSPQEEILELFEDEIIEVAQLHGSESEQYILDLKKKTNGELKIINAIEMTQEVDLLEYNDSNSDYLLLDSGKGSGKTFDWGLIRKDIKKEFFLAGGLNSENVTHAVEEFNPYAVDLSSSLETDDVKDENKIKEIMEVIN